MTNIDDVHIGKMVKSVFDVSGMTVSELARRLNCERTNVYGIFQRSTLDVGMLAKLSVILDHNFLYDAMQLYGLGFQLNINLSLDGLTIEKMSRLSALISELNEQS